MHCSCDLGAYVILFRRRSILGHFEDKLAGDIGGTDQCCDNCAARYVPASVSLFIEVFFVDK
jgi:hypothetical protein